VKAVGVKELKARLSEYLRLVKGGETILVTERNDVVAEVRPARRRLAPSNDLDDVLDALSEAGEVTRSSLPKRGWSWTCRGLGLPGGTAQAILDDVRGDR
jgi:antitoxin (DNA-binding transcriptional repressor) of toxin-antitoxin stability system